MLHFLFLLGPANNTDSPVFNKLILMKARFEIHRTQKIPANAEAVQPGGLSMGCAGAAL